MESVTQVQILEKLFIFNFAQMPLGKADRNQLVLPPDVGK